jgi:class 3 adenylate cyclase/pimeloyl-ACP methyl ester carboxylesterase
MTGGPKTTYATAGDGSQIAYQIVGKGPLDLVFLTGSLSHIDVRWEDPASARARDRMASFSRFISFDRRGVGASDRLLAENIPSWDEWADDLGVVLDAVGSDSAAICGVADGGQMAITFAATHPERTTALILCNTSAQSLISEDYPFGVTQEQVDASVEFREKLWGTEHYARALAPSAADDPVTIDWLVRYMRATATPKNSAAQLRAELQKGVRSVLSSVHVPTLVLHRRELSRPRFEAGRYLADHISGAQFVELPGTDTPWQTQYPDLFVQAVEEFLTGVRPAGLDDRFFSTVLFTDIVDSTRLASSLGDRAWHERLDAHDAMVRRQLQAFRGEEIKTTGDGFLATFDGPGRAVQCACTIRDGARRLGIGVRAGLHAGEIEARGDDIGGIAVNIGARVAALAGADEVLVSRTVTDLVAGSVLTFSDQGEHELKGIPGRWRLFSVVN